MGGAREARRVVAAVRSAVGTINLGLSLALPLFPCSRLGLPSRLALPVPITWV